MIASVPLRCQSEFRLCYEPAVVKVDKGKKLCLTKQSSYKLF